MTGKYWDGLDEQGREEADYFFVTWDEEALEDHFEELLRLNYYNERNYAVYRATLEKIDEFQENGRYSEERERLTAFARAYSENLRRERSKVNLDLFGWDWPRGKFIARTIMSDFSEKDKANRLHDYIHENGMWNVIEQLLREPPKPKGRPKGPRYTEDWDAIRKVKKLIRSGLFSIPKAALEVAKNDSQKKGKALESHAKRLELTVRDRIKLRDKGKQPVRIVD